MRDQARCSVNMMTGVEVATPQLLRVLGGRERKGRCLKNGGEKIIHPLFPYAQQCACITPLVEELSVGQ